MLLFMSLWHLMVSGVCVYVSVCTPLYESLTPHRNPNQTQLAY